MTTETVLDRFAALIAPLDTDEFLADVWPYKTHFSQAVVPQLRELLDQPELQDIESLVRIPRRGKCRINYTHADGSSKVNPPVEELVNAFNASNATIYLQLLQTNTLRTWCQEIDKALGLQPGAARVSAFTSPPGPGIGWHWDDHEIFVVQVRGTKRWYLAPEDWPRGQELRAEGDRLIYQAEDGTLQARSREECRIFDLTPGSVLFIPSDVWHTPETIEESLHLVMNVGRNVP